MKRKTKLIVSIVVLMLAIGACGTYALYNKVSNYIIEDTLTRQMTKELIEQTGIDLSEAGRILTPEETERFKSVLNTKEDIAYEQGEKEQVSEEAVLAGGSIPTIQATQEDRPKQNIQPTQSDKQRQQTKEETVKSPTKVTTDDLKGAIKKQAEALTRVVPKQDKSAMLNLVLGNLTSQDISYLAGLVLDGVSSSDLVEAKRIAKERFSQSELEQVKGYYNQYNHLIP